jgi:glycosyltransferase involved in cell wall biosynthesis
MIHGKTVSVVIPTLNEEQGIRDTLNLIPKFVDEIIVVDGDSKDRTREIAKACGATVILEKRKGYGRAFKTGFAAATTDIIATTDGDGTYPIEMLEEIIEHLVSRDLDFVSCARLPLRDRASMKRRNLIGNYLITKAASTLWGNYFADILSGMWVFRRACLQHLTLHSDSWNFSEEIKLQAWVNLRSKFAEYKIPYRERLGETKLVPWKVGIQNVSYLLAMRTGGVTFIRDLLRKPYDPLRPEPMNKSIDEKPTHSKTLRSSHNEGHAKTPHSSNKKPHRKDKSLN